MQLFKTILYNSSIISLFNLLKKEYQQATIIDDTTNPDTAIHQALTQLNIQWISKSLDYRDHNSNEIYYLHVFSVDKISYSMSHILNNILLNSNTFKIQNLILTNNHEPSAVTTNFFNKNERLHRNTLICNQDNKNITCWHWINENQRQNQTLKEVLNSPVNFNLSTIQIIARNSPPNAFTPCFDGKFIFTGVDAMVSAEIVSRVNATPKYCSSLIAKPTFRSFCNKKGKVNYEEDFNLLQKLKMSEKTYYEHIFYHTVFDSRMLKYLYFDGGGNCQGRMDLKMNTAAIHFADNMTSLIPTEFSCISIVVPKANPASSFIRRTIYKSVESVCFICTVIVFSVARIVISKSTMKYWFNIFYSTIGAFLAQTNLTPKTNPERIVYGFMLVTTVFTTVMLSGLIYTTLVNNPATKTIQTVDDLAASSYKILAMNNIGNWMDNLREDIREKLVLADHTKIVKQILTSNTSSAIAVNEHILNLFKAVGDSSSFEYRKDLYYEIKEKLHCGYFAYRISKDFPLQVEINQIIQDMERYGFITAYKKWSLHILKLSTRFQFPSDGSSAFTLDHILGIIYLYMFGLGISLIAFCCEQITKMF